MGKWHTTSDRLPIACFFPFHKPIQTFHQIKVSGQHTLYDSPKAIALGGHFVPYRLVEIVVAMPTRFAIVQ